MLWNVSFHTFYMGPSAGLSQAQLAGKVLFVNNDFFLLSQMYRNEMVSTFLCVKKDGAGLGPRPIEKKTKKKSKQSRTGLAQAQVPILGLSKYVLPKSVYTQTLL